MKNTLLITTLLAAGTINALAIASFGERGSSGFAGGTPSKLTGNEWIYSSSLQESHYSSNYGGWAGNIVLHGSHTTGLHKTGITHYQNQNRTTIELGKNARYELYFEFDLDQSKSGTSGDQSMAGMYLAGTGKSIYFGNAQLNDYGDRRSAVAAIYNADIADYNDDGGQLIYFPNDEFNYKLRDAGTYRGDTNDFYTVVSGTSNNSFDSGTYKLTVIIESFAEESKRDLIYFHAYTPEGTVQKTWELGNMGISSSQVFDNFGFILHKDGETISTPKTMMAYEYSRSLKPTEPEVLPDIPEPSAFGLLAGAGALALVAARRRRSRS